ncbi:MAG TPA: methylated-DNA--[protein]-cysteine S-methyltransferase [Candidatus Baltobacteraceae bacterium]|jgi:methylated-DNA-[protein]-cysteine S-methyltransferase
MMDALDFVVERIPTPVGMMMLVTDADGNARAVDWEDHEDRLQRLLQGYYRPHAIELEPAVRPTGVRSKVEAYFEGDLHAIDAIPVEMPGTSFQKKVWDALRRIPVGTTISYGDLATQLGRPELMRAVGSANGSNPIGVIVPCHRVIGADGSLTGYGSGIPRKKWLLEHEGVLLKLR